ncbi:MAG: alpha/beta fold hydrolase [Janthinobacterium lividum]
MTPLASSVVPFPSVVPVPARLRAIPAERRYAETGEGRRIAYVEAGSGPGVVLIHGTLMTADDMRLGPMPALSQAFRCVAVDRPGHGWSDHVRGADASLWAQMETIRGAVRTLGLDRPVICGHSFGGAVALAYAQAHPDEIAGAVALAPICFPEPRLEQMLFGARAYPLAGDLLSRAMGVTLDTVLLPTLWHAMFLPQRMPDAFAAEFPFARAGSADQMVCEAENAVAMWPDLTRSALGYASCRATVRVLCGTADLVVNTLTQGAAAAAVMPRARFDWLPGLGHMLHHARPDAVVEAVTALSRP